MVKLIKVKSRQPSLKVRKSGKVSFEYEFETTETVHEMPKEHADIVTKNPTFYVVGKEKEGESLAEKEKEEFIKELQKLNGIGVKTALDVVAAYVTRERLVEAVKEKHELPFQEDVCKLLEDNYGGD